LKTDTDVSVEYATSVFKERNQLDFYKEVTSKVSLQPITGMRKSGTTLMVVRKWFLLGQQYNFLLQEENRIVRTDGVFLTYCH
jgi:hypothetical protein